MTISMTGFGRGQAAQDAWHVVCELRSVNHRYLDLSIRLPHGYQSAEQEIRRKLQAQLKRGRVEATITLYDEREKRTALRLDKELATAYLEAVREISEGGFGDANQEALWVLEQKGVVELAPVPLDEEEVIETMLLALAEGLDGLCDMREEEGARLADDIQARLRQLHQLRGEVAELAASKPSELRDRLEQRLNELMSQGADELMLDPARLAQEAAILADKADVTEELMRLASHLQQLHDLLHGEDSEGRRMDFVLQEVNREINTIQSKSKDQAIDHLTIEMKALTEQIREQVQNIE